MQMMSNVIAAILALIPQLGCLAASCDNGGRRSNGFEDWSVRYSGHESL